VKEENPFHPGKSNTQKTFRRLQITSGEPIKKGDKWVSLESGENERLIRTDNKRQILSHELSACSVLAFLGPRSSSIYSE
jgi:hypothetical protein